jgi:hypothetical protein
MPYADLITRNDVPGPTSLSSSEEVKMAEQVKITNGPRQLTVSRKAFNAIFKTKGYTVIGEEAKSAVADDSESTSEASAEVPTQKAKAKAGSKRKASKKSAKKPPKKDPPASDESQNEES